MLGRKVKRRVVIFQCYLAASAAITGDKPFRLGAGKSRFRIAVVVNDIIGALNPERRRHHSLLPAFKRQQRVALDHVLLARPISHAERHGPRRPSWWIGALAYPSRIVMAPERIDDRPEHHD